MMESKRYKYTLTLHYPTPTITRQICDAVSVDKELNASKVFRKCNANANTLNVNFASDNIKLLRISVTGMIDSLALATTAIDQFMDWQPTFDDEKG